MQLKRIDHELYLKRVTKVFFDDEIIPDEFKDSTKYDIVIVRRHTNVRTIQSN